MKFSSYTSFVLNRVGQGGGVAILTKKNMQATTLVVESNENFEAMGVTIKLKNKEELDVISLYCPNGNRCNYEEIKNILTNTGNSATSEATYYRHMGRRILNINIEILKIIYTTKINSSWQHQRTSIRDQAYPTTKAPQSTSHCAHPT